MCHVDIMKTALIIYPQPVLQVLDAADTLERSIHHDGNTAAQCFTFFHAASHKVRSLHTSKLIRNLHPVSEICYLAGLAVPRMLPMVTNKTADKW